MIRQASNRNIFVVMTMVAALAAGPVAYAQETKEEELGWKSLADLSWVVTSGNSETSTLGFKNKSVRRWLRSTWEINAGGIKVRNTIKDKFAVGTDTDFNIGETTETPAENYFLNTRYDRLKGDNFFTYGGLGWDRNEPAGVENRYTASIGVGNRWIDEERVKFRTDYAATYTDQQDVVDDPTVDDTFAGLRVTVTFMHKLGENGVYLLDTIIDENLDETEDLRVDMTNSFAVSINSRLALKTSLQFKYDNLPALEQIPLFAVAGGPQTGTVPREVDELDTFFTTSLVISF